MYDNLTVHRKKSNIHPNSNFPNINTLCCINSHKLLFRMKKAHEQSLQVGQRQMELKMQRCIIFIWLVINDTAQNLLFSARSEHSVSLTFQRQRHSTSLLRYVRCLEGKWKSSNSKVGMIYFMTYRPSLRCQHWVIRFVFCFFNNWQSFKFIYSISRGFSFAMLEIISFSYRIIRSLFQMHSDVSALLKLFIF